MAKVGALSVRQRGNNLIWDVGINYGWIPLPPNVPIHRCAAVPPNGQGKGKGKGKERGMQQGMGKGKEKGRETGRELIMGENMKCCFLLGC